MAEDEQRYRQLIQSSPAPINLFDAEGEIIWGNDALLDLLGLDARDELIGRSIFEFIHPEDRYTAAEELADVVRNKVATGPTPMQLERDDGETRAIRVATAPGRYRGQDIGQAVVIDVTELNELKTALEEEQEFIQAALDVLDDVFYLLAPDGTLERWNNTLVRLSGYTPAEVRKMEVVEFFVPEHADRVAGSVSRALVEGADTIEATVSTKAGERIPYEFRKRRLVKDGDIIGVAGIGRDITQRKTREQHLRAVDYLLQHHLRNQLNIISGRTDLLAETADPEHTAHSQAIQTATDTMLSLFDHHRTVIDTLLTKTEREELDIVAVIDDLLTDLRATHPDATISLDAPDIVLVDAVPRIDYAFRELFSNALTHSRADSPELAVTITDDSTPITIHVRDNGPPIATNEYAFMADGEALKDTAHPSGLGLWLVNLLVKNSRGTFTIDHSAGQGNTITIELPAPNRQWHD